MKDIVIVMDTTLGKPADILQTLADREVHIVAGCLFPRAEGRVAHIAVHDDQETAVREAALEHGALVLDAREVLVIDAAQHGGSAAIARKVADAGAIVYVSYFGEHGEIVLATSDLAVVHEALGLTE